VDDHPLVRRGLAELIADEPDFEVCGESGDVAEALRLIKATHPDVVIVDLSLPSGSGIGLIEEITRWRSAIKTIVSSMYDD
jgi:DNA-binding NarL/FixJ family response regulator